VVDLRLGGQREVRVELTGGTEVGS
jgi:hypothetical protein